MKVLRILVVKSVILKATAIRVSTNMKQKSMYKQLQRIKKKMTCLKCSFETKKNDEINIHNLRKHTDFQSLKYPQTCEHCI